MRRRFGTCRDLPGICVRCRSPRSVSPGSSRSFSRTVRGARIVLCAASSAEHTNSCSLRGYILPWKRIQARCQASVGFDPKLSRSTKHRLDHVDNPAPHKPSELGCFRFLMALIAVDNLREVAGSIGSGYATRPSRRTSLVSGREMSCSAGFGRGPKLKLDGSHCPAATNLTMRT